MPLRVSCLNRRLHSTSHLRLSSNFDSEIVQSGEEEAKRPPAPDSHPDKPLAARCMCGRGTSRRVRGQSGGKVGKTDTGSCVLRRENTSKGEAGASQTDR